MQLRVLFSVLFSVAMSWRFSVPAFRFHATVSPRRLLQEWQRLLFAETFWFQDFLQRSSPGGLRQNSDPVSQRVLHPAERCVQHTAICTANRSVLTKVVSQSDKDEAQNAIPITCLRSHFHQPSCLQLTRSLTGRKVPHYVVGTSDWSSFIAGTASELVVSCFQPLPADAVGCVVVSIWKVAVVSAGEVLIRYYLV